MNTEIEFKEGDVVKTIYGKIRTVRYQDGLRVFVKEELNNWYHPKNIFKIDKENTVEE